MTDDFPAKNLVTKSYDSKLVKAVERSDSLRTTVPQPIVAVLGLEEGDTITWSFEPGSTEASVKRKAPEKSSKQS